jgi:hypothetical protein
MELLLTLEGLESPAYSNLACSSHTLAPCAMPYPAPAPWEATYGCVIANANTAVTPVALTPVISCCPCHGQTIEAEGRAGFREGKSALRARGTRPCLARSMPPKLKPKPASPQLFLSAEKVRQSSRGCAVRRGQGSRGSVLGGGPEIADHFACMSFPCTGDRGYRQAGVRPRGEDGSSPTAPTCGAIASGPQDL